MRVLVVDAEPMHKSMISFFLSQSGCQVYHSTNGLEDLTELEGTHFDFVVMDWKVQGWKGGETLKQSDDLLHLHQPGRAPIPILLYSQLDLRLLQFPVCKSFEVRSFLSKKASMQDQQRSVRQFIEELERGEP